MEYAALVSFYERLDATTKRLEMTDILVEVFHQTPKEEVKEVVYLTEGRIAPDYMGIELGLADKLAIRVLAQVSGLGDKAVEALAKEKGDVGLVAEQTIAEKRQAGLFPEAALTVRHVFDNLMAIAQAAGEGSQQGKIDRLADLLRAPQPPEGQEKLPTDR